MANIKVGDQVVQIGVWLSHPIVKSIERISPKTISLVKTFTFKDGGVCKTPPEPRQNPDNWRIAVPETVEQMQKLADEMSEKGKTIWELYKSLPKIEL